MRQDLFLDDSLQYQYFPSRLPDNQSFPAGMQPPSVALTSIWCIGRKQKEKRLTLPSSANIALGLSNCSLILLAISSLEPIISVISIAFFFCCLPLCAFTVNRAEGKYLFPLAPCSGGVLAPLPPFEYWPFLPPSRPLSAETRSRAPGWSSSSTRDRPSPSKPRISTSSDWISSLVRFVLMRPIREEKADEMGRCLLRERVPSLRISRLH